MNAGDCYELGRVLYNEKDYRNALAWMTEALRKYKEETQPAYAFTEVDVLEYISFSHYLLGELLQMAYVIRLPIIVPYLKNYFVIIITTH